MLVADNAPGQVLAGELAALEVERVAVAVVRRMAEDGHTAVVFQPAELLVVRNVTPDQVTPLAVPGWPLRPERAGPQAHDRGVGLPEAVEDRLDGEYVGIREVGGGWCMRAKIAGWTGDGARRCPRPSRRRLRRGHARPDNRGPGDRPHGRDEQPPRDRASTCSTALLLRH